MNKTKITNAEVEALIDKDIEELFESSKSDREEVLLVLQFHLHIENMLERIILGSLERGDKLLEKAGLSFHQKLCVEMLFKLLMIGILNHCGKLIQFETAHQGLGQNIPQGFEAQKYNNLHETIDILFLIFKYKQ